MLFFLQDTVQLNMKNFKKINELFSNITKQIYKRHDNNFLINAVPKLPVPPVIRYEFFIFYSLMSKFIVFF